MWKKEILYKGVTVVVVGAEYTKRYMDRGTTPNNWESLIENEVEKASLVIVEYLPVELERTAFRHPLLGKLARVYAQSTNIEPFFTRITDMCRDKGKEIAVADIANTPQYMLYDFGYKLLPLINQLVGIPVALVGLVQEFTSTGHKSPTPTAVEKVIPAADEARRLLTAVAIMQEVERWDVGARLLYIAPPAHSSRVEKYISEGLGVSETVKLQLYKLMIGLEKSLRVYKPSSGGGWTRISNIQI
jgi:hypothetical protein